MKKTYMKPTIHVAKLQQHNLICATQPNVPGWNHELDSRSIDDLWEEEEEEWP